MADLLLVDNDARILELMQFFLERAGHRVRAAATFRDARLRIRERSPDLMLCDLEMGSENGREELPRMAREQALPPTLVVSGYVDRDSAARLRDVPGVVGTLAKPFDMKRLLAVVEASLSKRDAEADRGARS